MFPRCDLLVHNTSRLSAATRSWLRGTSIDKREGEGHRWVECGADMILAFPHNNGWFVSTQDIEPLKREGFALKDLMSCFSEAKRSGCRWILFDDDVPETKELRKCGMLTVGNAHLSDEARTWLKETSIGRVDGGHCWVECGGDHIIAYPRALGWFVMALHISSFMESGFPHRDLLRCFATAHRADCRWIHFDAGGPVDEEEKLYRDPGDLVL